MRGGGGGAVGPAACWRPFQRRGVFCSRGRPGSLGAYSCQRSALHHSAASTREQRGPRTCWGWDEVPESPPPRSRHALCRDRPPAPAPARVLGGPSGGRRGTPGPGGRRRSGASRPPHPRACSLPFGLWPQPASVETVAGRAPVARPRGCFTSVSSLRVSPSFRPAPLPRSRPMTRPTAPPASGNLGAH